jgi:hypothetical protein
MVQSIDSSRVVEHIASSALPYSHRSGFNHLNLDWVNHDEDGRTLFEPSVRGAFVFFLGMVGRTVLFIKFLTPQSHMGQVADEQASHRVGRHSFSQSNC